MLWGLSIEWIKMQEDCPGTDALLRWACLCVFAAYTLSDLVQSTPHPHLTSISQASASIELGTSRGCVATNVVRYEALSSEGISSQRARVMHARDRE